jgi:hypothetical protein
VGETFANWGSISDKHYTIDSIQVGIPKGAKKGTKIGYNEDREELCTLIQRHHELMAAWATPSRIPVPSEDYYA